MCANLEERPRSALKRGHKAFDHDTIVRIDVRLNPKNGGSATEVTFGIGQSKTHLKTTSKMLVKATTVKAALLEEQ